MEDLEKQRFLKQMEFLLEIDKVKNIFRQTYLADQNRKENDAEHSWHSAMMTIILAEYFPDVDLLKAIKMMLFHDVVEIYAGDTYCYDEEGIRNKEEREKASANKVYGLLPLEQKKEFIELWQEFEAGDSPEAFLCTIVDRLQPIMLNDAAGALSWVEHNISKEQVLRRNAVSFTGPKVIGDYILNIIEKAYKQGQLK